MEEEGHATHEEQPSQKFAARLIYMMVSAHVETFGTSMLNCVSAMFLFNKLRISGRDWLRLRTIFDSTFDFLSPLGGIIADVVRNKFYLVIIGNTSIEFYATMFLLLSCPQFRQNLFQKWSILYTASCVKVLGSIVSKNGITAFIIDQFKLPEERLILRKYIQLRDILSNAVEILGVLISPVIKNTISCLGEQDCYLIVMAVYLILLLISHTINYVGYKHFIIKKPEVRAVTNAFPCFAHGLIQWLRNRKTNPLPHWLDHAEPAYGTQMVEAVKAMLRILFFTADELIMVAIRTIVAVKFNILLFGLKLRLGSYKMMPEHILLVNPILHVILCPLLMRFVEPRLRGTKLDRPFRWMIFAGLLNTLVFFCHSSLLTRIINGFPEVPELNEAQLRIFNTAECPCMIKASICFNGTLTVDAQAELLMKHVPVTGYKTYHLTIEGTCFDTQHAQSYLESGKALSIFIKSVGNKVNVVTYYETISRAKEASLPYLIIIGAEATDRILIEDSRGVQMDILPQITVVAGQLIVSNNPREVEIIASWYSLYMNGNKVAEFETDLGGIYKIAILGNNTKLSLIAPPNSVNFLLMIPIQIIGILTGFFGQIGEEEFSYMETPPSLRGLTLSLKGIICGFGYMLIPLFETNYRLDYEFYVYTLILFTSVLYRFIVGINIRSRHPGHNLI